MMQKRQYQPPTLKVVSFKVERGFAGSADGYSFQKEVDNTVFLMEFENYGPRNEQFVRTNHDETFFN